MLPSDLLSLYTERYSGLLDLFFFFFFLLSQVVNNSQSLKEFDYLSFMQLQLFNFRSVNFNYCTLQWPGNSSSEVAKLTYLDSFLKILSP